MPIFAGSSRSKTTDPHEFKPVLAEIQDRPPNPAGRLFLCIVLSFLILAIPALFLVEVDVVITARGKIVPLGDVKLLQPLETGVVRGIHVREGDRVESGALLVEIDPALDDADLVGKERNLRLSRSSIDRIDAVLDGKPFRPGNDTEPDVIQAQRHLYRTQRDLYRSSLGEKEKALRETESLLRGLTEEGTRLESLHRLLSEEEKRQHSLVAIGALAESRYREKVRERLQTEKELEMKRGQVEEVSWRARRVREEMDTVRNSFREKLLLELAGSLPGRNRLESEVDGIHFRRRKRQIAAPVNGTVHQLHVKTVGGVVTPAQPVVSLVPDSTPLTAHVVVANRDIGYVREGQVCIVKVDAYDFQKYGTLEGTVRMVSPFNVENKEQSSDGYPVFADLSTLLLRTTGGTAHSLKPGMTVTTEISVGKRKIIEFFLFPLLRHLDEGFKVR